MVGGGGSGGQITITRLVSGFMGSMRKGFAAASGASGMGKRIVR